MGTKIDKSTSVEELEKRILDGSELGHGQMGSLVLSILSNRTNIQIQKENTIFNREMEIAASDAAVKKMKDRTSMVLDIGSGIMQGATAVLCSQKLNARLNPNAQANGDLANITKTNSKMASSIADMGKTGSGISSRFSQAGAEEKRTEKSLAEEAKRTADAAQSRLNQEIDGLMQMISSENRSKYDTMRSLAQ